MLGEEIKRILAEPIATPGNINQLAAWLIDMTEINEVLATENKTHLDVIVSLRRQVDFYRRQTTLQMREIDGN